MDHAQPNNPDQNQINLDGPSAPIYHDAQVNDLYTNGLISRVEADVFDLIAEFNDGSSDQLGTK